MRIPPGVSAGDFAEAIKQFEEVVGKEWVFTSDEDVAHVSRCLLAFLRRGGRAGRIGRRRPR